MKKMPTVFVRNFGSGPHYVTEQVTPGCEWVLAGEGIATRKYDGTCCMLDEQGRWWARREIKPGKEIPPYFVEADHDEVTGSTVGWEPIGHSSFSRWHAEALAAADDDVEDPWNGWKSGTYELIGPKINGNPERYERHWLIRHENAEPFAFPDRSYAEMRRVLTFLREKYGYEGVVFKHPDGRMAKLKAKDFPA